MTDNELMTRDIHNFVRGRMNMKEGADLIEKVAKSEEWIDHLLFDMHLFEMAVRDNREKLNDGLGLKQLGIDFSSR